MPPLEGERGEGTLGSARERTIEYNSSAEERIHLTLA